MIFRDKKFRLPLILALYIAYIPIFLTFFRSEQGSTQSLVALSVVPVVLAGYFFGLRGSMLAALGTVFLNVGLIMFAGPGLAFLELSLVLPRVATLFVLAFVVGRMSDLNRRLRGEVRKRKAAEQEARRADRAKSEFLAGMSHEIRTPMNAVIGMADLLDETELNDTQREYVNIFRSAGAGLLNIINDILDFSRFDSEDFELDSRPFDLGEVLREVESLLAFHAGEKNLELTCSMAPDVPALLKGDPVRLKQILVNLIGNGIKFTEAGKVETRVELNERAGERIVLLFQVSDTGTGIPASELENVFKRFHQADSSITRKHRGTGLGLSIARRLVELHGGKIELESEPGSGTRVRFTAAFMPVAREDSEPPSIARGNKDRRPRGESVARKKLLIVEDNPDNLLLVRAFLKNAPVEAEYAENGRVALDKFKAGRFDLVIMDIQMPVMDGYTAAREMRAFENTGARARTPMIALTAYAMQKDIRDCLDAGFDAHMSKPVRKQELLRTIENSPAAVD